MVEIPLHIMCILISFCSPYNDAFTQPDAETGTDTDKSTQNSMLGPVYTKHQHQHCNNSVMMLAILLSLKTMESLQNGVATHLQAASLFSMRTVSLVSSELLQRLHQASESVFASVSVQPIFFGFDVGQCEHRRAKATFTRHEYM